jgi:hypothetical protein
MFDSPNSMIRIGFRASPADFGRDFAGTIGLSEKVPRAGPAELAIWDLASLFP